MENVLATKTTVSLDRTKPLVKDFFDRDAEIVNHLRVRMVHVPNAYAKLNKLFTTKDGLTHAFRVNWYGEVHTDIMTLRKIVGSQYVTVVTDKDGQVVSFTVR